MWKVATLLSALVAVLLFRGCASDVLLTEANATRPEPGASSEPPATDPNYPGADGKPSVPFGQFSYEQFAGYHLQPSATLDFNLYSGAPASGVWSPDYAAMDALARYHGRGTDWCWFDRLVTGNGTDCCATGVSFDHSLGFAGGAPLISCGQVPSSWRVGPALASVGLNGLHVARPLTAKELRAELANGRPVLARSDNGTLGRGALILIAGWSPLDDGGDRFLLVREGLNFQWQPFVDIVEGRADWLKTWTDSWFKISTRADGCVPSFDPGCARF